MHMEVRPFQNFTCAVDGNELFREGQALRCSRGHSYDIAKEGYCNLLLVQQKASKDPGDSKEMVAARTRFLELGHYAPIASRLFSILEEFLSSSSSPIHIADAGCGEGYYLAQLQKMALASPVPAILELTGFDISKWAVRAAAKRGVSVSWLVASNRRLPFQAGSLDLILCMFGFPVWQSFQASQPVGGRVILVDPGPDHLLELRQAIYPVVERRGVPSLKEAEAVGYRLEEEQVLKFTFRLSGNGQIQDLLSMTPHAYRMSEKGEAGLKALTELEVSADLVFRVLRQG